MLQKQSSPILRRLRSRGRRLTAPRQAIVSALREHPASVDAIAKQLRAKGVRVDRVTIYRTVALLESEGVVRSVNLGGRSAQFELASGDHHHHLVCDSCGTVQDVQLNEQPILRSVARTNFRVTRHSLEFFGTCANCQPT